MSGHESAESFLSRATVEGLVEVTRALATTTDLQTMLEIVCRAIVDVAQFDTAAINLVMDNGDLQVVAVTGPPDVAEVLLGQVGLREDWEAEFARTHAHHGLRLSLTDEWDDRVPTWRTDDPEWLARHADDPRAWSPDYGLFARMRDASGELVGVVSVDLPRSGLIPDEAQSATLEILSRQAETAITSARLLARSELNERIYRLAFDTAPSLEAIADPDGQLVHVNARFERVFGTGVRHARSFDERVTVLDGGVGLVGTLDEVFSGAAQDVTFVACLEDGPETRWLQVTVRGVAHTTAVPRTAICTMVDISLERRVQQRHQHDAEHDELTGLLNRRGATAALEQLEAGSQADEVGAVLACDLDVFKEVNDRFGHLVGDEVLVEVARRLEACTPEDAVLVRLGGDEFLVSFHCSGRREAEDVATAVVDSMRAPMSIGGHDIAVSISVGLATAPAGREADLVGRADEALYAAKQQGRSRWVAAADEGATR